MGRPIVVLCGINRRTRVRASAAGLGPREANVGGSYHTWFDAHADGHNNPARSSGCRGFWLAATFSECGGRAISRTGHCRLFGDDRSWRHHLAPAGNDHRVALRA